MPRPKFVVAVGDHACICEIQNGSYAVLGGAETSFRVDLKIIGNPPSPKNIIKGLLAFVRAIESNNTKK
jgi:Ni,Fe-hydrogenase III small subunit